MMRMTAKMSAAMKGARMRELRAMGYGSDVFPAKYRGGKCGLSGETIHIGDPVAYFREFGLCHAGHITNLIHKERRDALPKCGCGRPQDDEKQGCCLRCDWEATVWFGVDGYEDVTRDSAPLAPVPADPATNP